MAKYFFRIDDICPQMEWDKFDQLVGLLEKYGINPLLAVIPDNKDVSLCKKSPIPDFWQKIVIMRKKGFTVGMHGYQHLYSNKESGIIGIHRGSEFAGIPLDIQSEKIRKGKEILVKNRLGTDIFIAPGHSFDKNTIKALKEAGFKYISDGISPWPFEKYGIVWLPQIIGRVRNLPFGQVTICLHPNNLSDNDFMDIEKFIWNNKSGIADFKEAIWGYKPQSGYNKKMVDIARVGFGLAWYGSRIFSRILK